jgi:hypothetical protein
VIGDTHVAQCTILSQPAFLHFGAADPRVVARAILKLGESA